MGDVNESVSLVGLLAEIRTEILPNTSRKCHRLSQFPVYTALNYEILYNQKIS